MGQSPQSVSDGIHSDRGLNGAQSYPAWRSGGSKSDLRAGENSERKTKKQTTTPVVISVVIYVLRVNCPFVDSSGNSYVVRIRRYFESGTAMTDFESKLPKSGASAFSRAKPQPRVVGRTVLDWAGFSTQSGALVSSPLNQLMRLRKLRDLYDFEVDWGDLLKVNFPNLVGREPSRRTF